MEEEYTGINKESKREREWEGVKGDGTEVHPDVRRFNQRGTLSTSDRGGVVVGGGGGGGKCQPSRWQIFLGSRYEK